MRNMCLKSIRKIKWEIFKGMCFDFLDDKVYIAFNGTDHPQPIIVNQGYWSSKRLKGVRVYK